MAISAIFSLATTLLPSLVDMFTDDDSKNTSLTDKVVSLAKSITGTDTDEAALAALTDPSMQLEYKKALLADKYTLEKMYLADIADARNMQAEALKQDDLFSKRFIYYLTIGWSLFSAAYLVGVSFGTIPPESVQLVHTILGFLLGTAISGIFQFFYGSSQGSKENKAHSQELAKLISDKSNK